MSKQIFQKKFTKEDFQSELPENVSKTRPEDLSDFKEGTVTQYFGNGNLAVIKAAYLFTEVSGIFPITPSTACSFGLQAEVLRTKRSNLFGNLPVIHQYNSELGAIAGVHGALQNGVYGTTFTGSQGLLLMIPNLYKLSGQFFPAVVHVASRSIAKSSLSINNDNSDIYSIRNTATIMISSSSHHLISFIATLSHIIAINSQYPVIHFYDADFISGELRSSFLVNENFAKQAVDWEKVKKFRSRALSPMRPRVRGGHKSSQTYFPAEEGQNKRLDSIHGSINESFAKLNEYFGTDIAKFHYYGHPEAKYIIVTMGSIVNTIKATVNDLIRRSNKKYGIIEVVLYNPFDTDAFIKTIPESVRKITVVSKNKRYLGKLGEPLYTDVLACLRQGQRHKIYNVLNCRAGLGSSNISPSQIYAVYKEMAKKNSRHDFTLGVNDDLTHLSLPVPKNFTLQSYKKTHGILYVGYGGDGSVSAANTSAKIWNKILPTNDYYTYSMYSSLKATNVTYSILRVCQDKIFSYNRYLNDLDMVILSNDTEILRAAFIRHMRKGGILLINSTMTRDQIVAVFPNSFRKKIAESRIKVYVINAFEIADKCGLPINKTSMIMLAASFYLGWKGNDIGQKFLNSIEEEVVNLFSKKGGSIVESNLKAIRKVNSRSVKRVKVDKAWKDIKIKKHVVSDKQEWYERFSYVFENSNMPSALFSKDESDYYENDGSIMSDNWTFKSRKRVNITTPRWHADKCIQCNKCALVCPHATIRAILVSDEDKKNAPQQFETLEAVGAEGFQFRIQVDAENCVGCGLCAKTCPVDALEMVPAREEQEKYIDLTEYLYKQVKPKQGSFKNNNFKGVVFNYPYFEASGACPGCGETPYYRLLTQLFGKDMVIANATGCSSIYGGDITTPWATDSDGEGPAWANSLFEDNAEFGLGMRLAELYRSAFVKKIVEEQFEFVEENLQNLFRVYLDNINGNNRDLQRQTRNDIIPLIKDHPNPEINKLNQFVDSFVRKSLWIIGGDGWSFDIDFGGIKHILDSGFNVNILILNTETFSNTGGQVSGASATLFGGKPYQHAAARTELGQMFLTHKNVYVAQTSMGMNPNQVIKAMTEAESYEGPSVIIAYCPCISHGFNLVNQQLNEREAVLSGYWPIFRYDPRRIKENLPPLQIDFKAPKFELIPKFLRPQRRYINQYKALREAEITKVQLLMNFLQRNFETLKILSEQTFQENTNYRELIRDISNNK